MSEVINKIINPLSTFRFSNKEKVYVSLIIEASKNILYNGCASLKKIKLFDEDEFYYTFLSWCHDNKKNTDWRLAISFYYYLSFSKIEISHNLEKELIMLACSQWSYFDKTSKKTILISHKKSKNIIYGCNKSEDSECFREVFYIETNKVSDFLDDNGFMYWALKNDKFFPNYIGRNL